MQKELRKYWDKTTCNYSCSETMVYAANEFYDLGLDERSFKMMAGFSGGMFEGGTCGVLTGGIAVLGLIFVKSCKADSPELKDAVIEFRQRFQDEFKSKNCAPLKEMPEQAEGCSNLIYKGGQILEEVIAKYQK